MTDPVHGAAAEGLEAAGERAPTQEDGNSDLVLHNSPQFLISLPSFPRVRSYNKPSCSTIPSA
jgi:hypothetical protein